MRPLLALLFLVISGLPAAAEEVRVGILGIEPDPRLHEDMAYARIEIGRQADPTVAAEMAVADMALLTDAADVQPVLDFARVAPDALLDEAARMAAEARYIVLDLPAEEVAAVAEALGPDGPLLINATAREDWLRARCYPRLLHTAASDRMISDALIQHFLSQQWESVLVVHGPTERDIARSRSFVESAERYRLRVVEVREFDLSTNPADRESNNTRLLTGGTRDYDAVYIADDFGEYARYLPYRTALPRPVVGDTGLVPLEWHWSLERYGAPQVNSRFEALTEDDRRMGWQEWSVWIATRAVLTAEAKSRERGAEAIEAYMRGERFNLDGSKGVQMSFRPWSGQLRQPILLATPNAVIGIAPLEGFEHRVNTLDSLGVDDPEFACE